jgi:hypothetical protein
MSTDLPADISSSLFPFRSLYANACDLRDSADKDEEEEDEEDEEVVSLPPAPPPIAPVRKEVKPLKSKFVKKPIMSIDHSKYDCKCDIKFAYSFLSLSMSF